MPHVEKTAVFELFVPKTPIREAAVQPAVRNQEKVRRFTARIGDTRAPGRNGRFYSRELWESVKRRTAEAMAAGMVLGAVDHGNSDDNLSKSPIIWRDIRIAEDGGVDADFDLVVEHTSGRDLNHLINAGAGVGFSTTGYGWGRAPTKEEIAKHGLHESCEVMESDFELVGIDAVRNPSFEKARLRESMEREKMNHFAGRRASKPTVYEEEDAGNEDDYQPAPAVLAYNEAVRQRNEAARRG